VPVTAPDQIAVTAGLRSGAIASIFYRGGLSRAVICGGDQRTSGDLLLTSPVANGKSSHRIDLGRREHPGNDAEPLDYRGLPARTAAIPVGPAVTSPHSTRRSPKIWPRRLRSTGLAHALTIQT